MVACVPVFVTGTRSFFSPLLLHLIYLSPSFWKFLPFHRRQKHESITAIVLLIVVDSTSMGRGIQKGAPYFSSYKMDFIKNTESLWGRMVTTCANGNLDFFMWNPLTQYKVQLSCSCGKPLRVHKWPQRIACLLEENCILFMRGYAYGHGFSKTRHFCASFDQ